MIGSRRRTVGLQADRLFEVVSMRVTRGPPLEWHLRKYAPRLFDRWLGDGGDVDLALGVKREVRAVLRKRVHQI